jgi:MFS family permease
VSQSLQPVQSQHAETPDAYATHKAWLSNLGLFLIHGLVVSTWVSRIPAIQAKLHLQNGILGVALLGAAIGALTAIPIAGTLVAKHGSRMISIVATVLFCVTLIFPAIAFNFITLMGGLIAYGMAAGTMDVAMNAQGVMIEHHLGSPTMSRFHAMFSIGGMAGAALGGVVADGNIAVSTHLCAAAVILVLLSLPMFPGLMEADEAKSDLPHRLPLNRLPRILLLLSAIGFCMLLSEGAIADWTAVYLRSVLRADPGTAAYGYAVFSAAMAVFRLLGDAITTRLGRAATVRAGALTGALGLVVVIAAQQPAWSFPGFALTGAGFSVIVPLVFGSGGRVPGVHPGAGIATVTGLGYLGFLAGPPTIGFLAQAVGLRFALILVVAMCIVAAALAGAVAKTDEANRMQTA